MRAVQVHEFGPAEMLVYGEVPDPEPERGELLVAIGAAGVNRADVLFRSGGYHRGATLPVVPGLEGAGRVVATGGEVADFAVGDRVLAWGATGEPGFYAELAAVPSTQALVVPEGVSVESAAVLPVAWLSAWYCLRWLAHVQPGESVLILAAASGVGSAAVQIAKNIGATVIATAGSAAKLAWVAGLGADHLIDHRADDVVTKVKRVTDARGVDVVLDLVGGSAFVDGLRVVGRAGRVVAMANIALAPSTIDTRDFSPKNVHILGFQITDLIAHGWDPRPDLRTLLDAVATSQFRVPLDAVVPLAQAAQAHRRLEDRASLGKIVLTTSTEETS